ncbi:MAG: protein kinase domain-containing protein [Actinomycetota bacterium]
MTPDGSFLDLIAASTAPGWRVEPPREEEPWIEVSPPGAQLPPQGWKLHVSAIPGSAATVLKRALPVLLAGRAAFKVVATAELLESLNAAEGGVPQIGKFITVYPANEAAAVRVGVELDEATRGLRGPPVPSDRPIRPGSLVHYRYGAFEERMGLDPWGRPVPVVAGPGGEPVPDPRDETYVKPPWVEDPFVAAGVTEEPVRQAIGGRFAVVATLHRSPRGAVHLAADLETSRPCVLKQAWRDAAVGPDGRDAADHLRWEAAALERLAPDQRFPALIDLVEHAGELYLAMERVEGPALARRVARARDRGGIVPPVQALAWGRELADGLEAIHAAGLAYRDLTSTNVVVGDRLRLIDFEHAAELGRAAAPPGGTAGYASPQQAAGEPPSVADDVYALGAILYLLLTGAEPPEAPDPFALLDRPVGLLNPTIGEPLSAVVARCLDPDPGERYASAADARAALERAAPESTIAPPPLGGEEVELDPGRVDALARAAGDSLCEQLDVSSHSAAVVVALAEVVGALGEPRHAEGLARHASRLADGDPPAHAGGLLSGEGLVITALFAAARSLDDGALGEAAVDRSRRLATLPLGGPDLAGGLAGRLRVHLLAFRESGDGQARGAAVAAGDRLLATAEDTGDGPRWSLPQFAGRPGLAHLGWAHGLAGIAEAFLDLHAVTGDPQWRDVAEAAVRRLGRLAVPGLADGSGSVWPDVEDGPAGGGSLWSGAAGVSRFLLRAAIAGIPGADALADRGARTVARGARWAGPTLALGLAGSITLLLDSAEHTGEPRWRSEADAHVRLLESFAEDGGYRWRGIADPLDLAVGVPGIVLTLARLVTGRPDPFGLPLERSEDAAPRWPSRTGRG